MPRDDFSEAVRRTLAARVGHLCSNPGCRAATSGPQLDDGKSVNVGVGAHISAAAAGGPRFSAAISAAERGGIGNGIWLCQNCAKLIDSDPARYTIDLLKAWKLVAEDRAHDKVGKTAIAPDLDAVTDKWVGYGYIEEVGIAARLKNEGYAIQWVHAPNLHSYVETRGWEVVEVTEKDGARVRLKVREYDCEFMILMKKKA